MQFMGSLYVGDKVASAEYKIVEKVHMGKVVPGLYLIVLSNHPDNMLDLILEKEALQKCYQTMQLKVVGIAGDKKEAIELVQRIIKESLQKTGSADVRCFLKEKWEELKEILQNQYLVPRKLTSNYMLEI